MLSCSSNASKVSVPSFPRSRIDCNFRRIWNINLWILSRGCLCFSVISQTVFRTSLVSCYEYDEGHENIIDESNEINPKSTFEMHQCENSMENFPNSNDQPE